MDAQSGDATGFVLAAIEDSQGTIRALDVKAEILAAFVAVVAGGAISLTPPDCSAAGVLGTVSIVLCALAIVAIGLVIYPRSAPPVPLGTYIPTGTFFLASASAGFIDADKLAASASSTNWMAELSFELLKLSAVRKRKTFYFKGTLWLTCAGSLSFAIAAIAERV